MTTIAYLPNIGYLHNEFSNSEVYPICQEINNIKSNFSSGKPKNHELAGNIEKEYILFDSFDYIEKLVGDLIPIYNTHFKHKKIETNYKLSSVWVNFQKKYEFNPVHSHDGDFSFVIWINLPFDISKEKENNSSKYSNLNVPAHFEFQYTDVLGNIRSHHIPAGRSMQNNVLLFPSALRHCVLKLSW